MTKPVALLDVDGVFADFTSCYVRTIARVLGEHRVANRGPVDRWEVREWAELTLEERRLVDDIVVGTRGWCRSIEPLPGAVEAAARLREEAECVVVTSAWDGPYWHKERLDWIAEHMGIDRKRVFFAHEKYRVNGDLLLDDKPQNVVDWARAASWRRWGEPLLWHTSGNAAFSDPPAITRVRTWEEVFAAVARAGGRGQ
jgi:5'(3')-deoxyribonucleotidase